MKQLFIFCFCLLSGSILVAQQELELKLESATLKGTLLTPSDKKQFPVVMLISGSGPTDRNGNQSSGENNSLKMLAEELLKNGIGSFRYDKRGIGESRAEITEIDLRFDTFVSDAKRWVDVLAKNRSISKIIVAGHSEGSLIGMIAGSENKNVNGFVSIAGAGRAADVVLKEQFSHVTQEAKDIIYPMLDQLKKGDTIPNVPVIFYTIFRPSIQPYMISWLKRDPQDEIKKLKIPVLIIQGTTDIQVTETDAELLSKAQPRAELKIIKNMNHVLKDCDKKEKEAQLPIYSDPNMPLNKEITPPIVDFVKKIK